MSDRRNDGLRVVYANEIDWTNFKFGRVANSGANQSMYDENGNLRTTPLEKVAQDCADATPHQVWQTATRGSKAANNHIYGTEEHNFEDKCSACYEWVIDNVYRR